MPLGLTATGPRDILPGTEYNQYFTASASFDDPVISRDGSVEDAVKVMAQVADRYKSDTALLAPILKGDTLKDTCTNLWNFIYGHIQYTEDKPGVEQIRRPLRSWIERESGVDCDCMSVFASSVLKNLKIPHYFRITKYGKPEFQHVYVVVPTDSALSGHRGYFTIDGVIDGNDKEKPFTDHKDFNAMNGIPIHVLNGLGQSDADDQQLLDYLVQTRNAMEANPALVQDKICPCDAVPMFNYVIDNWSDPHSRATAIQKTAEFEKANFPNLRFFQKLWQYMEGQAQPGDVKSATYLGLGVLPDGAAGPPDPTSTDIGGDTTGGDTSWWSSWGSGVSSFLSDLLKTGVAFEATQNAGKTTTTPPKTTPGATIPPVAANQAGMSTGTVLITLGVFAALGVAIWSMNKKPAGKTTRK